MFAKFDHLPTHRHLPNRRSLRRLAAGAVGEQVRHERGLALPLQRDLALPGLPGSLDGAQNAGDGALFGERRKGDFECLQDCLTDIGSSSARAWP
jgi:hypothetical protein